MTLRCTLARVKSVDESALVQLSDKARSTRSSGLTARALGSFSPKVPKTV